MAIPAIRGKSVLMVGFNWHKTSSIYISWRKWCTVEGVAVQVNYNLSDTECDLVMVCLTN